MRPRAVTLAAWAALSLAPSLARADGAPSPDEWPVERNAQVLRHREWKVGMWGFDGGLADRLQIGSLWWSWPLLSPNVHLEGLLVDHGAYKLSLETSFLYLDLSRLQQLGVDDIEGNLFVLPVELHFDARAHERVLLGASAGYTFTQTSPDYDPKKFEGSAAYDSVFLHGHVTVRASERLWVVTELDWLLYQGAGATGQVEGQLDEWTHVSGQASAVVSALDPARGGAVTASLVVRQRRFGMRLGVGYGNLVVPRLRIVVPRALPYATLDLFARFGGPSSEEAGP